MWYDVLRKCGLQSYSLRESTKYEESNMHYNYHTHTSRCKHATGTAEEYIIRAMENGITDMGFSDHVPLRYKDGTESFYRVPVDEAVSYCEEIRELREKYGDRIKLRIGFEAEYYPEYFDELVSQVKAYGAEYLILGQHYPEPEKEGVAHVIEATTDADRLKNYVDVIISAMKTGKFTYVAHPDIFHFTGEVSIYQEEMRRLCIASRELNIPLEINFLGIRDNRNYPNEAFWQVAGQEKAPVTFGFDAHDVASAYDGASLEKAKGLVEKYGLNFIGAAKIRSL